MDQQLAQQLSEIPFGELLASMGRGVAEAQFALDKMSSLVALTLSGKYQLETDAAGEWIVAARDNRVLFGGEELSLLELGFTPTFYQFVDTILEIKVSISMTMDQSITEARSDTLSDTQSWTEGGFLGIGGTKRTKTNTTTVSSQFSSRFQYSTEGASVVRTKLVPVPPPSALTSLVRELAARNQDVP
jgi:hypothetical protein